MATDLYELLGVPRDADDDQIKRAYRKLAMEYHPDRNAAEDAADQFKEVTRAYEVLRDPQKRRTYDRYGESGLGGPSGGSPFEGFGGFGFADAFEVFMREFGAGGLGDLFGARAGAPQRQGSSIRLTLRISLEQAAGGLEKTIKVGVQVGCDRCSGLGAEPGSSSRRCATCNGVGEIRQVQRSVLGQFVSVRSCPECEGEGSVIANPCTECKGDGRVRRERMIQLEIPAGVSGDDVLKLRGRGNAGRRDGPPGDVIVQIQVDPHDRFERREDDLLFDLPVTFSQAALGVDLEVPTITGKASLTIPAGIQSGQVLRLRGVGMPHLRASGVGDQLVRVLVWTPGELNSEQRELLEQLAACEETPPEPSRDEPGFWERVKAAFTA